MIIRFGPWTVFISRSRRTSETETIEGWLRSNDHARERHGGICQDQDGARQGEIFLTNLREEEFQKLSLRTKSRGESARVIRPWGSWYENAYGDRETFAVYVRIDELEQLGIRYKFF